VTFLVGVALILILGVGAQWLAWQYRLPSIVLLLLAGFLAGPVFGILDPAVVRGDWVYPFVSVAVGIILFEGGLNLRISDLKEVGGPVRNLISVGVITTWLGGAGAIYWIEDFGLELSLLTGAILVVTGPTVIIPLLRQIRPRGRVGAVARWEGITIDPIGAILSVLVLEVILLLHEPGGASPNITKVVLHVARGVGVAGGASVVIGGGAAALLVLILRRRLVPDFLRNPITLTLVVVAFVATEAVQHEAGLLTTTLMGVIVANQKYVSVQHITEFKENLQVLLLGMLFVVLSSRVHLADLEAVGLQTLLLTGVLILLVRPLAVALSCIGTNLTYKERAFLAWLGPRGVVAAAMASLFAFDLQAIFPEAADALVPVVFLVIVATVTVYGLTIGPIANRLSLADPNPEGVLFLGAEDWVCRIAATLDKLRIPVQLVDSNPDHVERARTYGLPAKRADVLSETTLHDLNLSGTGRLLIMIPNDEVASLAALHFSEVFDSNDIFQLPALSHRRHGEGDLPKRLRGHLLFGGDASCHEIRDRLEHGDELHVVTWDESLSDKAFYDRFGSEAFPLFLVRDGELVVLSEETRKPRSGDEVVIIASGQEGPVSDSNAAPQREAVTETLDDRDEAQS